MRIVTLYRYRLDNGSTVVSPVKPDCEYTTSLRLVADDGKVLTDGTTVTSCVDTNSAEGWTEIDAPDELNDFGIDDMRSALEVLGVEP